MENPLVSIVMPVYNAREWLEQALQSVVIQTYGNWELVAIDDASSDGSVDILKAWARKDSRIRVIGLPHNSGVATALNRGINESRGEFIARMDADDEMVTNRLEHQVTFLLENPTVVAVGTFMIEINTKGNEIGKRQLPINHDEIYQMMNYAMGMQHPTIMFNKGLVPDDFTWYAPIKYAEDLDLLFRLLPYGRFANIPKYLYRYRLTGNNLSLKATRNTLRAALQIREKARREYDYRPNARARLLNAATRLLTWMPQGLVLELYRKWRGNTYE